MAIELSNVLFHYSDSPSQPVIDIPHWSINTGEQVFVHGQSGSGKSTLLNLLSGLLSPNRGHINITGQSLERMSKRQLDQFRARHIGYVFQQFNLIPYLNAVDNIQLANQFGHLADNKGIRQEIEQLLDALNIQSSDWYRPTRSLSIGQQQRVAIARALINKPSLLIADEPTSALDQSNRDAFMTLLMSYAAEHNITLLFVSHDLSLASYFERVESLSEINHQRLPA